MPESSMVSTCFNHDPAYMSIACTMYTCSHVDVYTYIYTIIYGYRINKAIIIQIRIRIADTIGHWVPRDNGM